MSKNSKDRKLKVEYQKAENRNYSLIFFCWEPKSRIFKRQILKGNMSIDIICYELYLVEKKTKVRKSKQLINNKVRIPKCQISKFMMV